MESETSIIYSEVRERVDCSDSKALLDFYCSYQDSIGVPYSEFEKLVKENDMD